MWPIRFKWNSGEYSHLCAYKFSIEIYFPGIAKAIKKLETNDTKEGMGVFNAPYGSMKDKLEELGVKWKYGPT